MAPLKIKTFSFSNLLFTVFIAVLSVLTLAYILFQARFILGGPQIKLVNVPTIIQSEQQIIIRGIASNITAIYLNGRPIVTDENGAFAEKVVLENGYTIVRVDAVDLYGHQVHVEEPFVYKPTDSDKNGLSLKD